MTPGERPSYWELLPKSDEFADLNSENVNNPDELKTKTAVPVYGNTITAGYMEEDWETHEMDSDVVEAQRIYPTILGRDHYFKYQISENSKLEHRLLVTPLRDLEGFSWEVEPEVIGESTKKPIDISKIGFEVETDIDENQSTHLVLFKKAKIFDSDLDLDYRPIKLRYNKILWDKLKTKGTLRNFEKIEKYKLKQENPYQVKLPQYLNLKKLKLKKNLTLDGLYEKEINTNRGLKKK